MRLVSRVLVHLGMLSHPIAPSSSQKATVSPQQVPAVWAQWCQRWHATSTLAASTRGGIYSKLLTVGRWLAQAHPDVESPEQWTRELALEFVGGRWVPHRGSLGTSLTASRDRQQAHEAQSQGASFLHMRIFFRDLQEWSGSHVVLIPSVASRLPVPSKPWLGPIHGLSLMMCGPSSCGPDSI